ncbi:MAG: hypothetical protein E4H15_08905 [Syntrophobacterales bacterium]|nr:MAG: hypothetical protein E4H15_08905 [Syntrophobacterales bacterium]
MSDTPLYNIRNIKIFVEYITKNYSGIDIVPILEYSGIATYQMEDDGCWLTQDQIDRFFEIVVSKTGNSNIAREAGRYSVLSKAGLPVQQYALGFITPATAYAVMEKLYSQVSLSCNLTTKRLGSNSVEISVTPKEGVVEKPYQCENRTGIFEGVAEMFTNELARIDHPACIHKGDSACTYIITWKRTP